MWASESEEESGLDRCGQADWGPCGWLHPSEQGTIPKLRANFEILSYSDSVFVHTVSAKGSRSTFDSATTTRSGRRIVPVSPDAAPIRSF